MLTDQSMRELLFDFAEKTLKIMFISVIVPVYNDGDTIRACLDSLVSQSYGQKEIIVVNDGSTDRTPEILNGLSRETPFLKLANIEHSGRSHARNEGFELSRGELVFFAEADAIYHSDYLTKVVEVFEDPQVVAALIEGEVWESGTFISRCMQAEVRLRNGDLRARRSSPKSAWIYRRDLLVGLGGFDEGLEAGEDSDLGYRLREAGYSIEWVDGISWWFKDPETLRDLLARSFWFGKEEVMGLYRKYPGKYPWVKAILTTLFAIGIVMTGVSWDYMPWVIGFSAMVFLVKLFSTLRRAKEIIDTKYAVALVILSPLRFGAFLVGNVIGLMSSVLNTYSG